ncbi:hypothetical protein Goari_003023, partial [Gossypium aridum]|nr:hypothetical protein [Gossypium aridum]
EYERSKVTRFSNWIGTFHQKFNSIKGENSSLEFLEHKYESKASLVMRLARHIFSEHLDHGISLVIVHGRFSACAPPPNPSPSPATSSNKFFGNNYKVWLWHNQNSKGNILQEKDLVIGKGGEVSTNEPINHYDVDFLDDEMEDNTAIF